MLIAFWRLCSIKANLLNLMLESSLEDIGGEKYIQNVLDKEEL